MERSPSQSGRSSRPVAKSRVLVWTMASSSREREGMRRVPPTWCANLLLPHPWGMTNRRRRMVLLADPAVLFHWKHEPAKGPELGIPAGILRRSS